jgi:NitT/TauT family transport system permease protein
VAVHDNRTRRREAVRALFRFRGTTTRPMELSLAVASFAILFVFWVALAESGLIREAYLPSPIKVAIAMYTLFAEFNFIKDVYISILRVMVAFVIAALMAIPIGIIMSSFRIFGAMQEPVIDLIRYLPVPALVPLTVIWLGIGETSKIALLWMGTFFQLVLLVAIVAANEGIGHVIWISRRFGKMPEVMAGVLAIGIIGLASDQLIRYFHRRAFRYLK